MSGRKRKELDAATLRGDALKRAQAKWDKIDAAVAKTIGGLYLPPEHPDHNPDADKTRAAASMKTWVSVEIMKQARADNRGQVAATSGPKVAIIVQGKMNADDWEAEAQRVDRLKAETSPGGQIIDSVPVAEGPEADGTPEDDNE